jgi:sRNA-binding carbon storage regulator CsrA
MVKVAIDAPKEVKILRSELLDYKLRDTHLLDVAN